MAYKWTLAVAPGGFSVHTKDLTDPDDVFPGTIPITADKAQDVEFKLWAKGNPIQVLEVERDLNILPGQDPNFSPAPNAGPTASLYQTDARAASI